MRILVTLYHGEQQLRAELRGDAIQWLGRTAQCIVGSAEDAQRLCYAWMQRRLGGASYVRLDV